MKNPSFSKNLKSIFFSSFTFRSERGTLLGLIGDYVEAEAGPEAGIEAGEGSTAILLLRSVSSNLRTDFFLCGSFILGAIWTRRTCKKFGRLNEIERKGF